MSITEARMFAGLDSERLRQIAEWLRMEQGHEETARRVELIADRHDALAALPETPNTEPKHRTCGPCTRGQHGVCDGENIYWGDCECPHAAASTDDREAMAAAIDPTAHRLNWYNDAHDPRDQMDGLRIKRGVYETVDRLQAAGFRRPSPPTEEQVAAAKEAWSERDFECRYRGIAPHDRMRAALEAAARVGGEG